ncbi:glycosyltransferase [Olsenella sp. YH-ols2217]|uniref:Glycosyltransferase n=1 Tax=Kribbibacterium absianum TaxID=3044210 RepID=A0ABT6ZM96_9ACTN|nr:MULTISPECIES: glycosyltransferase family 2 protein [unclassified Olsenella]MDJ1122166.1 glycosyltransferase [Olsenella sp. YH-ols2216]MDJ1130174.1 glycosyltransferase [Olsenella sp. YH-ols2217]
MADELFLSVVVPVYKIPEDLLRACLASLAAQPGNDLEFIVIDDGSPDRCGTICDEVAATDERFSVLHTPNQGVAVARNTGIDHARGSHVLFVDGDDQLPEGTVACLRSRRTELGDITCCEAHFQTENGGHDIVLPPNLSQATPSEIALSVVRQDMGGGPVSGTQYTWGSIWGKVFDREFLDDDLRFPVGVRKAQDRVFMLEALAKEPRLAFLRHVTYVYVRNGSSICQAFNPQMAAIERQSVNALRGAILGCYSGHLRVELLNALPVFGCLAFIEVLTNETFSPQNPARLAERHANFLALCRSYSWAFQGAVGQTIQLVTYDLLRPCLERRLYNAAFAVAQAIFLRRQALESAKY